jgi:hypothetical protein
VNGAGRSPARAAGGEPMNPLMAKLMSTSEAPKIQNRNPANSRTALEEEPAASAGMEFTKATTRPATARRLCMPSCPKMRDRLRLQREGTRSCSTSSHAVGRVLSPLGSASAGTFGARVSRRVSNSQSNAWSDFACAPRPSVLSLDVRDLTRDEPQRGSPFRKPF